ncbi:MAG: helix-turn-helix transcriptional regulator [Brooklawnia sp.]|nr:helix-turn-helix transcriptional regulator [Brooklawnia sp.]
MAVSSWRTPGTSAAPGRWSNSGSRPWPRPAPDSPGSWADERLDLCVRAFGLPPREADVVRRVARGLDTASIAAELHLATYTIQDHLKSIFAKTGLSSRRQPLVGRSGCTKCWSAALTAPIPIPGGRSGNCQTLAGALATRVRPRGARG